MMSYCGPTWVSDYTFGARQLRLADVMSTFADQPGGFLLVPPA